MKRLLLLGLALLLTSGVALAATEIRSDYEIPRWVIGSGGGQSSAGDFNLVGTAGQPVTGTGSGASYGVCSGFWPGPCEYEPDRIYLPLVLRSHP